MAGKPPAQKSPGAIHTWFQRHSSTLLLVSVINIVLLSVLHIFISTFSVVPAMAGVVQVFAVVMVSFIFLTVVWKGIMPAVICMLGIVLMHNAIILPFFPPADPVFPEFFYSQNPTASPSTEVSIGVAAQMHFFLGLAMVAFSIITAYKPSLFFAKNRPKPLEDVWSQYPIWYDNVKLVGGFREKMVPVKSLMTDQDRYLLWRYEYVLANIYGTPHLVKPTGLVPKDDTAFVRDKASGLIMGKARYTGYFM